MKNWVIIMLSQWWEKFLNLFTEEIPDEKTRQQKRRPGRMEENNRPVRPRMIAHYPNEKASRPPVRHIRNYDRPPVVRRQRHRRPEAADETGEETRSERPTRRSRRTERPARQRQRPTTEDGSSRKERPKFTGVDFRASDVPSPVYGFRQRPVKSGGSFGEASSHSVDGGEALVEGRAEEHDSTSRHAQSKDSPEMVDREQTESGLFLRKGGEEPSPAYEEEATTKENDVSVRPVHEYGTSAPAGEDYVTARAHESAGEGHAGYMTEGSPVEDKTEKQHTGDGLYIVAESDGESSVSVERDEEPPAAEEQAEFRFHLPPLHLLDEPPLASDEDDDWIREQRGRLSETLSHFHVEANVVGVTKGPAVTRFEVQPAPGVKVNKITKLSDDLKLSLAAKDIRMEAPIPGKSSIGIEIPNRTSEPVFLRTMLESPAFRDSSSPLTAALGLDISGTPIVTDLQKMPHGLIGGATGSGKSVCINSLLVSLLYKASPEDVKLVLIDPKVVELAPFQDIPHLAAPVINDAKEAALALKWAVDEMERRYERFAECGARDITRYNRQVNTEERLPYIVIVIDELADLMMVSPQDVEDAICRIAQKARACGIHLVIATQRPSVDVITGLIKANIPTRLAFSVSSQADSRTILDMGGAEKLLGHGDMLFVENGAPQSVRVQGNFVSDEEIDRITDFVRRQGEPDYLFAKEELQEANDMADADDELFEDACFYVLEQDSASVSALQRKFRIGYNRAARLIEMMEALGMISEAMGSKPRQVLMSEDEFLEKVLKVEA